MVEVNPVIGSGFNARSGAFEGDSRPPSVGSPPLSELGNDHPFHNVDHSTMMAMKKALIVLQKVKGDNSAHQIADRLYLGSIGAALNLPELQSTGITHILCTATGVRSMHPDKFVYKILTVLDSQSESLLDHFADSIHWLECVFRENPNNKVLVHCFAGRSRSVAIVLAYLMYKLRIPLSVALLHVRQFRASANPNVGFINQLKAFEQELLESSKSFAFDSMLDDLNSLVPGAKGRLENIKDGRVSTARASSEVASPRSKALAMSDASVRAKSSAAAIVNRRLLDLDNPGLSDRTLSVDGDRCPPSKKPFFSYLRAAIARWMIVILLIFMVVGVEKVSFPYYSRYLCDSLRPHSRTVRMVCNRVSHPSRRIEEEIVNAFNRTVHLLSSVMTSLNSFPKI